MEKELLRSDRTERLVPADEDYIDDDELLRSDRMERLVPAVQILVPEKLRMDAGEVFSCKQTNKLTNKQNKQTNKQTVICSSTCLNGGTCQSASCQCRGGYAGNFCQVNCFHFLETFARSVAFTFWGLLPGQLLLLFGDFFQVNCFLFLESFARSIAFTFWRLLPGQLLSLFGDFCQPGQLLSLF